MCLLTYLPPNTQPNLSRLNDGCEANPDGFGYAIVTADQIIVGKGLEHESVLLEFLDLRREHPEGPALFHSRITTHGATDLDNCHPFYVNKDERTVLAHNGILPASVQPRLGDLRSDTRIAAEQWIPRHMGRVHKAGVRRSIERWMGKQNKMVILTIDPRSPMSAYILNEEAGHWAADGCWYSNSSYQWGGWRWHKTSTSTESEGGLGWPSTKSTPMILGPTTKDMATEQSCIVCSAVGWTSSNTICPWCDSCQECLASSKTCMCNYDDDEEHPTSKYDEGYRYPTDGHGACPVCGSYYVCGCTDQDYLDYLMKDEPNEETVLAVAEFKAALDRDPS